MVRHRPHRSLPVLLVPAVLVLSSSCQRSEDPAAARGGGRPSMGRAVTVRTAPVSVQDVVYEFKALGSLEPEEMVQVTAEVDGAVSEVRFHEGDRVTRDTVLVLIDPERYQLELARSEAALLRARADEHRAKEDLVRRERLARDELIAEEELNRSRAENERLAADVAAAVAALDIARQNRRRAEVRAPRAGTINTRAVETGQYVRMGAVLATLVDVSRLKLRFKISEAESLRAREGGTVAFRVAPLGAEEFDARIYHVGDVADPATRQVEVLAWVKNPGELKPGFFAEVTLATESRQSALVVPEGAVQASEKGFVAYTVEEGKARLKPIQIGQRTGAGLVEVLSGLKPGETVVVEGSDLLADGVAVQDVAEGFETPPDGPRRAR